MLQQALAHCVYKGENSPAWAAEQEKKGVSLLAYPNKQNRVPGKSDFQREGWAVHHARTEYVHGRTSRQGPCFQKASTLFLGDKEVERTTWKRVQQAEHCYYLIGRDRDPAQENRDWPDDLCQGTERGRCHLKGTASSYALQTKSSLSFADEESEMWRELLSMKIITSPLHHMVRNNWENRPSIGPFVLQKLSMSSGTEFKAQNCTTCTLSTGISKPVPG